jgi:hypothetical protein
VQIIVNQFLYQSGRRWGDITDPYPCSYQQEPLDGQE